MILLNFRVMRSGSGRDNVQTPSSLLGHVFFFLLDSVNAMYNVFRLKVPAQSL